MASKARHRAAIVQPVPSQGRSVPDDSGTRNEKCNNIATFSLKEPSPCSNVSSQLELVKASAAVREDKELLLFPLISSLSTLLVLAAFAIPMFGLARSMAWFCGRAWCTLPGHLRHGVPTSRSIL